MSKTHDNFFTKYDSLKNLGSFADLKNDQYYGPHRTYKHPESNIDDSI